MRLTELDEIKRLEQSVHSYYQTKHNSFYRFFCCIDEETDRTQFQKHIRLAALYAKTKQFNKAISGIEQALAESDTLFFDKKMALSMALDYALQSNAKEDREKAYKLQLTYASTLTNVQRIHAYQGLFQTYLEQNCDEKAAQLYRTWMSTVEFEGVPRQYQRDALITLGDLLLKQKKWSDAHVSYVKAEKTASANWPLTRPSAIHQRILTRLLMTSALLNKDTKRSYYKKVLKANEDNLFRIQEKTIQFTGESDSYNTNEYLKFAIQCLLSNGIFENENIPLHFNLLEKSISEKPLQSIPAHSKDVTSSNKKEEKPLAEYEKIKRRLTNNWEQYKIGGYQETIELILKRLLIPRAFSPEQLEKYQVVPPNAALFYGPPGTGKTYIASRIAEHLFDKDHVSVINGPELFSPLVGNSEAKMRGLFDKAKRFPNETFVYIFDEIESLVSKRSTSDSVGATVSNRLTSTLLTVLDGVEKLNNIIVIGVTNFKDNLDEALLRSGRMGENVQFEIGLPKYEDRLAILRVHLQPCIDKGSIDPNLDLDWLAGRTEGFTAADIKALKDTVLGDAIESIVEFTSEGIVFHDEEDETGIMINKSTFERALKSFKHQREDNLLTFPKSSHVLRRSQSAHL